MFNSRGAYALQEIVVDLGGRVADDLKGKMSKEKTSPKRKRTLGQWLDSPNVSGYVFVGPFIIGFLAFMMVPMLLSFAFSFTRYNILQSPTFIGLENYITMFTDDPKFWKVF